MFEEKINSTKSLTTMSIVDALMELDSISGVLYVSKNLLRLAEEINKSFDYHFRFVVEVDTKLLFPAWYVVSNNGIYSSKGDNSTM